MGKSLKAYLDRIEGDKAVILLGERHQHHVIIPVEYLPDGVSEGAVLSMIINIEAVLTRDAIKESSGLLFELAQESEIS